MRRVDPVAQWYDLTAAAVATAGGDPVESSRIWAITWLAAYRAVRRTRLGSNAAVAAAIHDVLVTLVPSMAADAGRSCLVGTKRGAAAGRLAAADGLADRAADGPNAARWQPFLIRSVADVAPAPPLGPHDARYVRDLAEVRAYGAASSTRRNPAQARSARFWAAGALPVYTVALRAALDRFYAPFAARVELVAFAALITMDTQIAAAAAGEIHPCWPPERALAGAAEPDRWIPLIRARAGEPAYPCPHAAYAGAAEIVLTALAGHPPRGDWRHLTAGRVDAGVWGGTHLRASGEAGAALGRRVAFRGLALDMVR